MATIFETRYEFVGSRQHLVEVFAPDTVPDCIYDTAVLEPIFPLNQTAIPGYLDASLSR